MAASEWRKILHRVAENVEKEFDERAYRIREKLGWRGGVRVYPYRGYATGRRLVLSGRVLQGQVRPESDRDLLWHDLVRLFKRLESDEVPGARLLARFGGEERELVTDDEGYFAVEIEAGPARGEVLEWHDVEVELLKPAPPEGKATAVGRVMTPAAQASCAIVSDLDDTVVETGATDKLKMARTVFLNNARTRTPFPGVAAFYRALEIGPRGGDRPRNPIFYVSSSPWNIYDLFVDFMKHQEIPRGPIFLRDFGLTPALSYGASHEDHKLARIRQLMGDLPDLPFVLIGDSGQRDPEIYAEVITGLGEAAARRIRAVYLRDVSDDPRDGEVRNLITEAKEHGVEMRMVPDTATAARHAAEHGLIPEAAVEEVAEDRAREMAEGDLLSRLVGRSWGHGPTRADSG